MDVTPEYCFVCGGLLTETCLGMYECVICLTVFLPFIDESGSQAICIVEQ